jgi:hypothetical protein
MGMWLLEEDKVFCPKSFWRNNHPSPPPFHCDRASCLVKRWQIRQVQRWQTVKNDDTEEEDDNDGVLLDGDLYLQSSQRMNLDGFLSESFGTTTHFIFQTTTTTTTTMTMTMTTTTKQRSISSRNGLDK